MKVLGIHGIRCGSYIPEPSELTELWHQSLAAGLANRPGAVTCFEVAFWADCVPTLTAQSSFPELADTDSVWATAWLAALKSTPPPHGMSVQPQLQEQGPAMRPVRELASFLINRLGLDRLYTERVLSGLLGEVDAYFSARKPGVGDAMRQRFIDKCRSVAPDVVVAHSLGSVIAFDALTKNPDVAVPLFVTLGSPLAMPNMARRNLTSTEKPLGVRRWINFADDGDFVAVPRPLSKYYDGLAVDETITITSLGDLAKPLTVHSAEHYLKHPRLAEEIAATFSRTAR